MNLVIFKLSPIGDTVMFLPVVQALRRLHPDWQITVFTTPATATLFRTTIPAADLIVVERGHLQRCWRRPWVLLAWVWRLRRLHPSAILLSCDQSSVARFLALVSGAKIRVGGAGSLVRLQSGLTHTIEKLPAQTIAEWEWSMAHALMRALGETWPEGPMSPVLVGPTGRKSRRGRPRVIVHAGGSRDYLRWMPARFAALATALSRDFEVTWIDLPEIGVSAPEGTQAITPAGLDEFLELTAGSALFVGNHSGAFHLAAALGVPCVVLAGPSPFFCDPPWHREQIKILRASGLACLPCDRLTGSAGYCQNEASPMACMDHWKVEVIDAACRDWMQRWPGNG